MNNKCLFLILITCLISVFSCDSEETVVPTTNMESTYQPLAEGNYWLYDTEGFAGTQTYKITVTGQTIIDGKQYTVLENDFYNVPGYIRIENGNYYSIGTLLSSGEEHEVIILKDNVPVGTSWEVIIPGSYGEETKLVLTIDGKDLTHIVNGETYSNVIRVEMKTYTSFQGNEFLFATEFQYWALNIGLIEQEGDFQNTVLADYQLN